MKLTTCLMLLTFLQVGAKGVAQRVSLNENKASLEKVLKKIGHQTGYTFLYENRVLKKASPVTLKVDDAPLNQALQLCFEDQPLTYKIFDRTVVIKEKLIQYTLKNDDEKELTITPLANIVTGRVTNSKGEPLVGVSVVVKGAATGTSTNGSGNYSIDVPADGTLVFSYVGYTTQEMAVNGRSTIDVALETANTGLDEVVVVGYGTEKRRDLTGAITSVQDNVLNEVPKTDIAQALEGRLAGVEILTFGYRPGAETQIRVRGARSLTASNDPLIVLDGVPFYGQINEIAPSDIKSIDILKDASATAIYGSRGANGVFLITTYRGDNLNKMEILLNAGTGLNTVQKKYDMMSVEDFIKYRIRSGYEYPVPFMPQELENLDMSDPTNPKAIRSWDWQDIMYQTGLVQNYDLSVRGGNQSLQGNLNFGYNDETSTLPGQRFTRYNVRGSLDFKATKWLKMGLNMSANLNFNNGETVNQIIVGDILQFSPLINPWDKDGNLVLQPQYPRESTYNPLFIKDKSLWAEENRRFSSMNTAYAEIQFMPELRYRMNLGFNYMHGQNGRYYSKMSNQRSGDVSQALIDQFMMYSYNIQNLLYYDKNIQKDHRISATLLYELESRWNETVGASGEDMIADYMQWHALDRANDNWQINSTYSRRVLTSYMGRLNYGYKGKYNLTVTGRTDGSSVLGDGHKWTFYPSVGASWNMHGESFMESTRNIVTMLRLRAGYGKTSNQSVEPYGTLGGLSRNNYHFGSDNVQGYYPATVGNPDLGWEHTQEFNLGIDFSFWNRVSGDVNIYTQKTVDLIVNQGIPASAGSGSSYLNNVGETQNRGVEFALHSQNIVSKSNVGFTWNTDLNLSTNRNKIVKLPGGVTQDVGNGWFKGYPINVIYDIKKIGIWQDTPEDRELMAKFNSPVSEGGGGHNFQPGDIKILDYDGNGQISTNSDRFILGTFEPNLYWGLTNRFNYANFGLTVVMNGQIGGMLVSQIYQNSYLNMLNGRYNQLNVDYWVPAGDPWLPEGNPTNDHPRAIPGGGMRSYYSTMTYFDADFARIRTMTLSYTLPDRLLSDLGISSMRLYVTCNNVGTIYSPYVKKGGLDPQVSGMGTQNVRGNSAQGAAILSRQQSIALGTPPTRTFIFGVNVKL